VNKSITPEVFEYTIF